MTQPSKLTVGTFFEEVDDNGVVHYYWVLAIANTRRRDGVHAEGVPPPLGLPSNLAFSAASTEHTKRITWDISGVIVTDGMPVIG